MLTIQQNDTVICRHCNGLGIDPTPDIELINHDDLDDLEDAVRCPVCNGHGWNWRHEDSEDTL